MARIAPYGSWNSPITTDILVEKTVRLADPLVDGASLYWIEGRPSEGGRQVIVRRDPDGTIRDVLPEGYAARTLVHEYGGLCYAVSGGDVFFSNFTDQRLYRIVRGGDPEVLSPEPPSPGSFRYAAPAVTPDGAWLVCVRERHLESTEPHLEGAEPHLESTVVNDLVAVSTTGDQVEHVLASGHDFYGSPAVSPDGARMAWCTWDHPRMPWDGTELWEAELTGDATTGAPRRVAGGPEESVTQPRYGPHGDLYFISDRTGWWNLYVDDSRAGDGRQVPSAGRPLAPASAEFAGPDWVFGLSSYGILDDGAIVATWTEHGQGRLGVLRDGATVFEPIVTPYTVFGAVRSAGSSAVALASSSTLPTSVVAVDLVSGGIEVLKAGRESTVAAGYISEARPFEFPTGGGLTAHALVYLPANADFVAPPGEKPPLIVAIHGGPTSATSSALNYEIQYWTSRGFAVADVNYGGSSGYGRAFRQRLAGKWGVVDVEDCENAALALAAAGEVDGGRLVIHGGSAGGYTTLCATTFGEVFAAGASYFGVADAGALARETHKFESRYLDGLIGPWPEAEALYAERSPLFHTDRMRTPLIVFQGLEDKVVPPSQAEMMVDALRSRGVPVAYIAYEGEQHGFRRAENIKRTAEAELYFYGRVLGFEPAGPIEPVEIENAAGIDAAG